MPLRTPREPGDTPRDHLLHTLDAFDRLNDQSRDDEYAIVATTNFYGGGLRTGLTWGDLRALADGGESQ